MQLEMRAGSRPGNVDFEPHTWEWLRTGLCYKCPHKPHSSNSCILSTSPESLCVGSRLRTWTHRWRADTFRCGHLQIGYVNIRGKTNWDKHCLKWHGQSCASASWCCMTVEGLWTCTFRLFFGETSWNIRPGIAGPVPSRLAHRLGKSLDPCVSPPLFSVDCLPLTQAVIFLLLSVGYASLNSKLKKQDQ